MPAMCRKNIDGRRRDRKAAVQYQPGPIRQLFLLTKSTAPPEDQSAMLANAGHSVTSGDNRKLPEPFMVLATQRYRAGRRISAGSCNSTGFLQIAGAFTTGQTCTIITHDNGPDSKAERVTGLADYWSNLVWHALSPDTFRMRQSGWFPTHRRGLA
jgi:hypothetical protein